MRLAGFAMPARAERFRPFVVDVRFVIVRRVVSVRRASDAEWLVGATELVPMAARVKR